DRAMEKGRFCQDETATLNLWDLPRYTSFHDYKHGNFPVSGGGATSPGLDDPFPLHAKRDLFEGIDLQCFGRPGPASVRGSEPSGIDRSRREARNMDRKRSQGSNVDHQR